MFICTECKTKFANKPQYCDCGNDIFNEESLDAASKEEFLLDDDILADGYSSKKSFVEQYPQIKRFLDSADAVSASIFALCIFLSILSWIFIGRENPNMKKAHAPVKLEHKQRIKKIPSLDAFWDNSHPAQTSQPSEVQPPMPQDVAQVPQPQPFMPQPPQRIVVPSPAPSPVYRAPKPVSPERNQNASNASRPKVQRPSQNTDSGALNHYKGALRQTLFSHLSVASVQGVGQCQVEFSIDNSGKLLGRRFSRLSDNKSLNDAVYSMLMSVPQFSPPPPSYNGEKIRLNFSFNNGYYEVSY